MTGRSSPFPPLTIRKSHPMVLRAGLLLAVVLGLALGCSTRRVTPSRVSAADAAAKALAQYDTNKDGFLDAAELERCPGLKNALKRHDTNKDGRFSREELEEYFGTYAKSQI